MHKKQDIILRYFRDGESIRRISRETGVSRHTVDKYVDEYASRKEAIHGHSGASSTELIESIVEAPRYDSSTRQKRKLTAAIVTRVKECLVENTKKRSRRQHKQQLKKRDIHELLQSEGHDIGYTSICALINSLEGNGRESFINLTMSH